MTSNFMIKLNIDGFDKLNQAKNTLSEMKEEQKAFNSLLGRTKLGKIGDLNNKLRGVVENFKKVGGLEGVLKMITANLIGVAGGIKAIGIAILTSPALPIVLAIGAAVLLTVAAFKALKRIVALNVGGIKGSLLKAMTQFKTVIVKVKMDMDMLFLKMAPTFKTIGKVIGFVMNLIVGGMKAIWPIQKMVLGTMIEAFNEIGSAIGEVLDALGITTGQGQLLAKVFKVIAFISSGPMIVLAKTFVVIAKVIGFVIRGLAKIIEYVKGSKILQKVFGINTREEDKPKERAALANANNRTINQNNNNNVVIQSTSPMTPETAPAFGNLLVNSLGQSQKVGL